MTQPIPINIAVEDPLSEAVLRRLLVTSGQDFAMGTVYGRGGVGYLRRMVAGFNNAARAGTPFLVLADLDRQVCAPEVIAQWLPHGAHANLLLRFAVREVEAWVMGDAVAFARFLGVRRARIPDAPESLGDPKRELVNIARFSTKRDIRADIVPLPNSTAPVGRNYNARLGQFVVSAWRPNVARQAVDSLDRAICALETFQPTWRAG